MAIKPPAKTNLPGLPNPTPQSSPQSRSTYAKDHTFTPVGPMQFTVKSEEPPKPAQQIFRSQPWEPMEKPELLGRASFIATAGTDDQGSMDDIRSAYRDRVMNISQWNRYLDDIMDRTDAAYEAYLKNTSLENYNAFANLYNEYQTSYADYETAFNDMKDLDTAYETAWEYDYGKAHPEYLWSKEVGGYVPTGYKNASGEDVMEYKVTAAYSDIATLITDTLAKMQNATTPDERSQLQQQLYFYQSAIEDAAYEKPEDILEYQKSLDAVHEQARARMRELQPQIDFLEMSGGSINDPGYEDLKTEVESIRALNYIYDTCSTDYEIAKNREVLDSKPPETRAAVDSYLDLRDKVDMLTLRVEQYKADPSAAAELAQAQAELRTTQAEFDRVNRVLTVNARFTPEQIRTLTEFSRRQRHEADMLVAKAAWEEEARNRGWLDNMTRGAWAQFTNGVGYLDLLTQRMTAEKNPYTGQLNSLDYNTVYQKGQHMSEALHAGQYDAFLNQLVESGLGEDVATVKANSRMNWFSLGESFMASEMTAALGMMMPSSLATLFLASGAATSTAHEYHNLGYSDGVSLWMGTAAGFAEYATEAVEQAALLGATDSMNGLHGRDLVRQFIVNNVVNPLTEGLEETESDLIQSAADTFISSFMNVQSRHDRDITDMIAQGMTQEEAEKAWDANFRAQLKEDFLAGMLSGLAGGVLHSSMGVVNSTLNSAATGNYVMSKGNMSSVEEFVNGTDFIHNYVYDESKNNSFAGRLSNAYNVGRNVSQVNDAYLKEGIRAQIAERTGRTVASVSNTEVEAVFKKARGYTLSLTQRAAYDAISDKVRPLISQIRAFDNQEVSAPGTETESESALRRLTKKVYGSNNTLANLGKTKVSSEDVSWIKKTQEQAGGVLDDMFNWRTADKDAIEGEARRASRFKLYDFTSRDILNQFQSGKMSAEEVMTAFLESGYATSAELTIIQRTPALVSAYEKLTGITVHKTKNGLADAHKGGNRDLRMRLAVTNNKEGIARANELRAVRESAEAHETTEAAALLIDQGMTAAQAEVQASLIQRVLNGEDLSEFDMRRLDLDDQRVRTVFAEKSGLLGMPTVKELSLTNNSGQKRAYLDLVAKEARKAQMNQQEVREELNQQGVDFEDEETPFKRNKLSRRENKIKSKEEMEQNRAAARANRRRSVRTKGMSPYEVVNRVQAQSGVAGIQLRGAWMTLRLQEMSDAGIDTEHLTTAQRANLEGEYEKYLKDLGLKREEIDDIVAASKEIATVDNNYRTKAPTKTETTTEQTSEEQTSEEQADTETATEKTDATTEAQRRAAARPQHEFKAGLNREDRAFRDLVAGRKITDQTIRALDYIGQKLGVEIRFAPYIVGRDAGGNERLANAEASTDAEGRRTIFLAVNEQDPLGVTLIHETVHVIKGMSKDAYNSLRDTIISIMEEQQNGSWDKLLAKVAKDYRSDKNSAYTEEEAVCQAVGVALGQTKMMQSMAAKSDSVNWLQRAYRSVIEKLTKTADRVGGNTPMWSEEISVINSRAKRVEKAFQLAMDRAAAQNGAGTTTQTDVDGDPADPKNSLQALTDGMGLELRYSTEMEPFAILDANGNEIKEVTPEMVADSPLGKIVTLAQTNGYIGEDEVKIQHKFLADIMNLIIKTGDAPFTWAVAGTQVFSAMKDNSDDQYGKTIDFSTVCKKTQAIVNVMSKTMMKLQRGLTREEVMTAYLETGLAGESTPCPVCYVFSRWIGIGGILDQMNRFQNKFGSMSDAELTAYMKKYDREFTDFARAKGDKYYSYVKEDGSAFTKRDAAKGLKAAGKVLRTGAVISDIKSKYKNKASKAEKELTFMVDCELKIAELEALKPYQKPSAAKSTQSIINRIRKKYLNASPEQIAKYRAAQQKIIDENTEIFEQYEAYQWLARTMMQNVDGQWVRNNEFKPVPPEVLFNLNAGSEFAEKYPLSWSFRTGKGCAAGKAIVPYSDARVGETIQGVSVGKVSEIQIGKELNPFLNGDVEKQKQIIATAIRKMARQNLIGGMRYQSTSDFRYEYGSDYLMTFLEMQAIGAKVQLYTKVIEAVDFLAGMGADCNLSVMPLSDGFIELADGTKKLVYSDVTGINAEAAIAKTRQWKRVQLRLVGISDEHIRLALAGTDVTFVIPFHGSGNSTRQIQEMMNLLGENLDVTKAQDYTEVQSDHIDKEARAKDKNLEKMWNLRMDIILGNLEGKTLTAAQKALLDANPYLQELYDKFYTRVTDDAYHNYLTSKQAAHIFPYEYWNTDLTYAEADQNGERFKEYCRSMGIIPRFSGKNSAGESVGFGDFTNDPGYWKLLIDRRMYENTYDENGNWTGYGQYHFQKRINATGFKIETLDPKYGSLTYGDVMSKADDPTKTDAIVERVISQIEAKTETGSQYSLTPEQAEAREFSDVDTKFSLMEGEPPKHTIGGPNDTTRVYKAFYVLDGKLYPPMITNLSEEEQNVGVKKKQMESGTMKGLDTPVLTWLKADVGALAADPNDPSQPLRNERGRLAVVNSQGGGTLAFRPGWHLGAWPDAKQFNVPLKGQNVKVPYFFADGTPVLLGNGNQKTGYGYRRAALVFAECEIAADVDYQLEAMSYGMSEKGTFDRTQAGLPRIPENGYYLYRTNADPTTPPWFITGAIKVNRLIDDAEAERICAENNIKLDPRENGMRFVLKPDNELAEDEYNLGLVGNGKLVAPDGNFSGGPADPTLYRENAANLSNKARLEEALAARPDAYQRREINFNNAQIKAEFARNGQDLEKYRALYEQNGTNPISVDGSALNDVDSKYSLQNQEEANSGQDSSRSTGRASVENLSAQRREGHLRGNLSAGAELLSRSRYSDLPTEQRRKFDEAVLKEFSSVDPSLLNSVVNHVSRKAPYGAISRIAEDAYSVLRGETELESSLLYIFDDTDAVLDRLMRALDGAAAWSQSAQDRLTDTEQFRKWYGRGPIDQSTGKPLILYHGTYGDFFTFEAGDIGFHVGTLDQAEQRMRDTTGKLRTAGRGSVKALYAAIQNPMDVFYDLGEWSARNVAQAILDGQTTASAKARSPKIRKVLTRIANAPGNISYDGDLQKELRFVLQELGYDGIRYPNAVESFSPDPSYIAFSPSQLKSADLTTFDDEGREISISSRFDRSNPDTRYSLAVGDDYTTLGDKAVMLNDRIDDLIEDSGAGRNKKYAQKWITSISTTDFLNLTLSEARQNREEFDSRPGDYGESVNSFDYLEALKKQRRQTPFLNVDEHGNVIGHEGRHRIRALEKAGVKTVEITVSFYESEGPMIKDVNEHNGRLESMARATFTNQYGTGQTAQVSKLIPLNLDHRDEILATYGENNASENDVRYSLTESDPIDTLRQLAESDRSASRRWRVILNEAETDLELGRVTPEELNRDVQALANLMRNDTPEAVDVNGQTVTVDYIDVMRALGQFENAGVSAYNARQTLEFAACLAVASEANDYVGYDVNLIKHAGSLLRNQRSDTSDLTQSIENAFNEFVRIRDAAKADPERTRYSFFEEGDGPEEEATTKTEQRDASRAGYHQKGVTLRPEQQSVVDELYYNVGEDVARQAFVSFRKANTAAENRLKALEDRLNQARAARDVAKAEANAAKKANAAAEQEITRLRRAAFNADTKGKYYKVKAAVTEINAEAERKKFVEETQRKIDDMKKKFDWEQKTAQSDKEQSLKEQRRIFKDQFTYATATDRTWARGLKSSEKRETKKEQARRRREAVRAQRAKDTNLARRATAERKIFREYQPPVYGDTVAPGSIPDPTVITSQDRPTTAIRKLARQAGQKFYRTFVNAWQDIDNFADLQDGIANADTLAKQVLNSNTTAVYMIENAMVGKDGRRLDDAMRDVFLCWDENHKVVDKEAQAALNKYRLHLHNIDRMSVKERARQMVREFEAAYPWLSDMTSDEFAMLLYGETITLSNGDKIRRPPNDIALRYYKLLTLANNAQDKPVFGDDNVDENGNPSPRPISADVSREVVAELEAANPWLKEKSDAMDAWWDNFMREWAVGTSISEDDYNIMQAFYPHYTPTHREGKLGIGAVFANSQSIAPGPAVKAAKGSYLPIRPIEDQFAESVVRIIKANRVNALTRSMIESFVNDENGDFASFGHFDWNSARAEDIVEMFDQDGNLNIDDVGTVETKETDEDGKAYRKMHCYIDGKRFSAYITENMYNGLRDVTKSRGSDTTGDRFYNLAVNVGSALTGPMKTMITGINPLFAFRNVTRDVPTAIVNSVAGVEFPKYMAIAVQEMAQNSPHWQQFAALGGRDPSYYNNEKGLIGSTKSATKLQRTGKGVEKVLTWAGENSESMTRFAEYLATLDKLGDDSYESRLLAIKNAAEVTVDFSRRGTAGTAINAWIPYWNPAVQGIDKVIRSVIEADGWGRRAGLLGRAAATAMLPEVLILIAVKALGRDKDWEELSDYTKANYYCIPIGGKDGTKWIKIAKNREWGAVLGTPLERIFDAANGRENAWEGYVQQSIVGNFLPPGVTDMIGLSQYIDLLKNENYAGASIIPYDMQDGNFPLSEQYDNDTSILAWGIAQLAKDKLSPMQLDYIIHDYCGDFVSSLLDLATVGVFAGEDDLMDKVLDRIQTTFVNPFVADSAFSNQTMSDYYDMLDYLDTEVLRATAHSKSTEETNAAQDASREYHIQTALAQYGGFKDQISALSAQARATEDDEEKKLIKQQMAALAHQAIDFYNKCMAGEIEDPEYWMYYSPYGEDIYRTAMSLREYASDYNFKPLGEFRATSIVAENKDGVKTEYTDLTAEDAAMYNGLRNDAYSEALTKVINSSEFRNEEDPALKAYLLDLARTRAEANAKNRFLTYLEGRPTTETMSGKTGLNKELATESFARIYGENIYSKATMDLLTGLYDYKEDYSFMPTENAPTKFTAIKSSGLDNYSNYQYELNSDQQAEYMTMYSTNYEKLLDRMQASSDFRSASAEQKASMLTYLKTEVANQTKEQFQSWLTARGVKPTEKKDDAREVTEMRARYASYTALGDYRALSSEVSDTLIALRDYTDSYGILPTGSVSSSYTDPSNKKNKYYLTDEEKAACKELYYSVYDAAMSNVIASGAFQQAYRTNDYETCASILAATRDGVTTLARNAYIDYLANTTVSEKKRDTSEYDDDIENLVKKILGLKKL